MDRIIEIRITDDSGQSMEEELKEMDRQIYEEGYNEGWIGQLYYKTKKER